MEKDLEWQTKLLVKNMLAILKDRDKPTTEDILKLCPAFGYHNARALPDGTIIAVCPMLFTTALIVGISEIGYERRYCYERDVDAFVAANTWDGIGDPPGDWVKEIPGDRLGPGAWGGT